MANDVMRFLVTVPAGTPQGAPAVTLTQFRDSVVERIDWHLPPGCAGLVGFQIAHHNIRIYPATPNTFFTGDNRYGSIPVVGKHTTGDWSVRAYNTGAFDHTIHVDYWIRTLRTEPQGWPALASDAELSNYGGLAIPDVPHTGGNTGPPDWPFPVKNIAQQSRRTDQGWDLQYPGTKPVPVYAVESGTVQIAGPDPGGFGNAYPLLVLDSPALGWPAIYYGHTFPLPGIGGRHVAKGGQLASTGGAHSGGNAAGLSNWLEIGFWSGGPVGNGTTMKAWLTGAVTGPGGGGPVPPNPIDGRKFLAGIKTAIRELAKFDRGLADLDNQLRTIGGQGWTP